MFTCSNKRFCTLLDFDEVSAILQALHLRALLSRSSGEMKFDSSSCMLKPVYFAFVKTMLEFFLQTTHFVKSRAHSPRPTSKIIAMIALRRAILMKADPVVSLHAHRLFSGRACSSKKDPGSRYLRYYFSVVKVSQDMVTSFMTSMWPPFPFTIGLFNWYLNHLNKNITININ